jgi:hypothetical protein
VVVDHVLGLFFVPCSSFFVILGTLLGIVAYPLLRDSYVYLPTLVAAAICVLASGTVGARSLSVRVATAATVSDPGDCGGGSAGVGEGDYLLARKGIAGPGASVAISRLQDLKMLKS